MKVYHYIRGLSSVAFGVFADNRFSFWFTQICGSFLFEFTHNDSLGSPKAGLWSALPQEYTTASYTDTPSFSFFPTLKTPHPHPRLLRHVKTGCQCDGTCWDGSGEPAGQAVWLVGFLKFFICVNMYVFVNMCVYTLKSERGVRYAPQSLFPWSFEAGSVLNLGFTFSPLGWEAISPVVLLSLLTSELGLQVCIGHPDVTWCRSWALLLLTVQQAFVSIEPSPAPVLGDCTGASSCSHMASCEIHRAKGVKGVLLTRRL